MHLVQGPELLQSPLVISRSQSVCHLKDHRIQHRLRHRIHVRLPDLRAGGIGCNLLNFSPQSRHGAPGDVNEIGAELRSDGLLVALKMSDDPGRQVPLALLGELHHRGIAADGLKEFLLPPVRLVFRRTVCKYQAAIGWQVRQEGNEPLPVLLSQLKEVHIVHPNEGPLCHHRQILHTIGEGIQGEGLCGKPVVVELLGQRIRQLLPKQLQIVLQKIRLLPPEEIAGLRGARLNRLLQPLQGRGRRGLSCHMLNL